MFTYSSFKSALIYFKMCIIQLLKLLYENNMGVIHKYMRVRRQQSLIRKINLK